MRCDCVVICTKSSAGEAQEAGLDLQARSQSNDKGKKQFGYKTLRVCEATFYALLAY